MEEIKRCPFCGAKGYLIIDKGKRNKIYYIHVRCCECNAQGKTFFSPNNPDDGETEEAARAVAAWNRRT